MLNCKLCNQSCKSWGSLSKHIRDQHQPYSSQQYYDEFLLNQPSVCKVCAKPVLFVNLNLGYKKTCGHKCGGIFHRRRLENDNEKHKKFKDKVAINQAKIWKERKDTDTINLIATKIRETLLGITTQEYELQLSNITSRKEYYYYVKYLTEKTYKQYQSEIDPQNLRGNGYHLDHRYSIIRGYCENIDPKIIASKHNLQILSEFENIQKSGKCSINITTLKEQYYDEFPPGHLHS